MDRKLLQYLLKDRGITQAELAEKMGMAVETLSRKMDDGTLGLRDAEIIIEVLRVEEPGLLFFPDEVTRGVT